MIGQSAIATNLEGVWIIETKLQKNMYGGKKRKKTIGKNIIKC